VPAERLNQEGFTPLIVGAKQQDCAQSGHEKTTALARGGFRYGLG